MADPLVAIQALFEKYAAAQSAMDIQTLGSLHWQDDDFTHVWSPGQIDRGWEAYARRLKEEFQRLRQPVFRFSDLEAVVFEERFAAVSARWRCAYGTGDDPNRVIEGSVTFTVTKMGSTWQIVADHYAVS